MSFFQSRVTDLFNIRHPLVLAPMGGASGGLLARSVSEAGGLGLVGASYGDPDWMKVELAMMEDLNVPWGVGLVMFTVAKNFGLLDLALSYRPDVVALSFGDPEPFIGPIHKAGALAVVQIHEMEQAHAAIAAGADALIVQGAEAGGHSLRRATLPFIPAVRDAVGDAVPLIAAGGIADGRGLMAALALGADAAMLGTRFLASNEALPSREVKCKVVEAKAGATVRTRIFDMVRGIDWPAEYSGRALKNDFSATWVDRPEEMAAAGRPVRDAYAAAIKADDVNVRAIWAGEVLDLIRDIRPAAELVDTIMAEAAVTLAGLNKTFAVLEPT